MKYICLALLVLTPTLSSAHTRWFAEGDLQPLVSNEPTGLYLSIWGAIIITVVAIAYLIHKMHWLDLNLLLPKKSHVFERASSTFTMVVGTFFIIAGSHEYLFSPNLVNDAGMPEYLMIVEILVGLALLLGIGTRVAGLVLAGLWLAIFPYAGWVAALEDLWVLSTAGFIVLMGNDYFSIIGASKLRTLVAPYKHYALSVLRIGTGGTLMVLGLSEKIFAPEFGINFLASHNWNFMTMLGFNYSDYLFTLSAGSVEFLFGLIFVLGLVTRLNALVVAVVFTIPLFILGPIELAGHLPHFAAVVLLLLFGGGGHFTFFSDPKYK